MSPQVPDDHGPEVFFAGAYKYRTGSVMLGALVIMAFGIGFGYQTITLSHMRGGAGLVIFGSFACACLLLGVYLVYLWAVRRELVLRVTGRGVEYGGRFWPWHDIARVGGVTDGNGVEITLHRRGALLSQKLATTPPLDRKQFDRVAALVQSHLARHHPHVRVDPEPHIDTSG